MLSVESEHESITFGERLAKIDWEIQGGESGRGAATFRLERAHDLIPQCRGARAAYFLKQLGSVVYDGDRRRTFEDGHAGDWSEWPQEVRIPEMPRRIVAGVPVITSTVPPRATRRTRLRVVEAPSKGTQEALEAWATRRENERRRARSEAATQAWRTRRRNEENGVAYALNTRTSRSQ